MSTYKTKNPLGSAAVKDLYDNAENVDKFVNDRTKEELEDRLGVLRKTWHGMEMIFSRFIDYITGRGEQAVAAIGWQELGNWAVGLAVDNRQQIVYYNGSWYKYLGELEHVIAGDSPENDGGVWSAENPTGKWSNIGDAALRSNLGSSEEGQGAWLVAYAASESAASRSVASRLRDYVSLHDYWFPDDGDDYYPALNKALSVSPHVLIPPGKHYLKSTGSLISGTRLIGLGPNCILSSPDAVSASGAEMLTVLRTTGASDILLQGLTIEGGCSEIVSTKRAVRGVRFIECQDVRVIDCEVNNTGDWALSFEKSDRVSVSRYKHRGTVVTNLNGGRDGLHFLDCVDFSATDLDIVSGDDMVGCTTETRDQRNASIKGV